MESCNDNNDTHVLWENWAYLGFIIDPMFLPILSIQVAYFGV